MSTGGVAKCCDFLSQVCGCIDPDPGVDAEEITLDDGFSTPASFKNRARREAHMPSYPWARYSVAIADPADHRRHFNH